MMMFDLVVSDHALSVYQLLPDPLDLDRIADRKDDRRRDPCDRGGVAYAKIAEPHRKRECRDYPSHKLRDRADHGYGTASKSLAACAEQEDHSKRYEEEYYDPHIQHSVVDDLLVRRAAVDEEVGQRLRHEEGEHIGYQGPCDDEGETCPEPLADPFQIACTEVLSRIGAYCHSQGREHLGQERLYLVSDGVGRDDVASEPVDRDLDDDDADGAYAELDGAGDAYPQQSADHVPVELEVALAEAEGGKALLDVEVADSRADRLTEHRRDRDACACEGDDEDEEEVEHDVQQRAYQKEEQG